MKRVLLVMAALLIGFGSVSAKKRKEVKSDLVGVWQQVNVHSKGSDVHLPILKMLHKDGTFTTMILWDAKNEQMGQITQTGVFNVQSDSVYTEKIEKHLNPKVVGSTVTVKYRFAHDHAVPASMKEMTKDILVLEFENGMREIWTRISDTRLAK